MKLLKCGMACCVFLSIVAWQTKDTSLQPTDAKRFYRRDSEEVRGNSGDKTER